MRITDPEAIAQAELRLAEVQSALDEVRRVLRAVEKVERTAQKGRSVVRPVAIATVGGVAVVVVVRSVLRGRRSDDDA
jgi:hypothetical protein